MKKTALFTGCFLALTVCLLTAFGVSSEKAEAETAHSHCLCVLQSMEEAANHTCETVMFQAWSASDVLPTESGSYYLTTDVSLTVSWVLPEATTLNLCLNGHTVSGAVPHIISTYLNGHHAGIHLSVTDCVGTGKLVNTRTTTADQGAAVFFGSEGGTFDFYAGTLTMAAGSTSSVTGGVVMVNNGTMNMYGGTVTGGKTTANGANLFVTSNGTANMYGGTITNGYATKNGGGVYLANGSFTMYGGEIYGNTTEDSGGNMAVQVQAKFTMKGGMIRDGLAKKTDANYTSSNIFVHATGDSSACYLEGGVIKGRVFVMAIKDLGFSGTPVIHDGSYGIGFGNTHSAVTAQNLRIGTPDSDHLRTGADIYVSSFTRTGNTNFTFASGDHQYCLAKNANADDAKFFTSNRADLSLPAYHDGTLILQNLKSHCICGGTLIGRKNGDGTQHTCQNVTWTAWTGEDAVMPKSTGNYYIANDFTTNSYCIVNDGALIRIDLNGHRVTSSALRLYTTYTGSAHVNNIEWNFCDTSLGLGEVKMSRTTSDQGAILWGAAKTKSVMTLYGGTYYASNLNYQAAQTKNGALFAIVSPTSQFTMYDGVIRGGHAVGDGGNLFFSSSGSASYFRVLGGSILNGTSAAYESGMSFAGGRGGNIHVVGPSVLLSDCTIAGGTAVYGVQPPSGAFMGLGGNVYISTSQTVTVKNVTVTGGKARQGGNLYLTGTGVKTISDSVITGGHARESEYVYYITGDTEKHYSSIPGIGDSLYLTGGNLTLMNTAVLGENGFNSVYAEGTGLNVQSGEYLGTVDGTDGGYVNGGYFAENPAVSMLASEHSAKGVVKASSVNPDLTLNWQVISGFELFTTTRAGECTNITQASGGGVYESGAKPTVTATPVSGYRLLGWYTEDENGVLSENPVGTEYSYTFTAAPVGSVMMVAVFEEDESKVLLTVSGEHFSVGIGNGPLSEKTGVFTELLDRGTEITLSYTDTEKKFVAWQNVSKKIISRLETGFSFTLGATTHITAQTQSGLTRKTIVFYNDKQQVMKEITVETFESSMIPDAPLRIGQSFRGWRIRGNETVLTKEELTSEIQTILSTETIAEAEMVYQAEADASSLFLQKYVLSSGVLTKVGTSQKISLPSTGIKQISADTALGSGETFRYAAIAFESATEIVSTLPEFMVKVNPGETVQLVYESGTEDATPKIAVTQALSREEEDGSHTYSFASSRNIPDGYEILSHGLILTNDVLLSGEGARAAAVATHLDEKRSAVMKSNDLQNCGVMTLNLGHVPDSSVYFYVRAFVVLKDEAGTVSTEYSDLLFGSAEDAFDVFMDCDFSEGATIPESREIGALNTVVYLPIETKDGKAPVKVSLTSSDARIQAFWTESDPMRISLLGTESGVNGAVSAVVDGIKAGTCSVTVKTHTHAVDTYSHILTGQGTQITWTPWTDATAVPRTTGNYYLETDVHATQVFTLPNSADVKLCLNGHTVTFTGTTRLYSTYATSGIKNAKFSLCECRETTGEIVCDSDVKTNQGSFFWGTGTNNELNIYGGTVRAGENYTSSAYGALLSVEKDFKCNMYGGTIQDGFSTVGGGNVAVLNNAEFHMYGGTISGGTIHSKDKNNTYGGNVYMTGACTFEMFEGAVVTGGQARENIYAAIATSGVHQGHGGNFYISGGASFLSDHGVITEGYCAVSGGNIQIGSASTVVTLRDTEVTNGFSWMGGGIVLSAATLNIEGHTVISGNTYSNSDDSSRGGGIVYSSGTLNLSGTPYIYDNLSKRTGAQNNLHLMPGISFTPGDLQDGAKIGVTCAVSTTSPGVSGTAEGFALSASDKKEFFVPDEKTNYIVKAVGTRLDMAAFEGAFKVGFARYEVTPEASVPLAGYGRTQYRMSTNILDDMDLEVTCIAITGNGGTVLMISVDTIRVGWVDEVRAAIQNATGIPGKNILMTATHTHSGPDVGFSTTENTQASQNMLMYKQKYIAQFRNCAVAALEDQADVTQTFSGDIDTVYTKNNKNYTMNWVRHYTLVDGQGHYAGVKGDNFNQLYNKTYTGSVDADGDLVNPGWSTNAISISGHTTDADPSMRLIKFARTGGKKDVVLVNWRAHPHKTGGSSKTDVSPDLIAPFRKELERQTGCLSAYFQGAAGNVNNSSNISGETYSSDYIAYGKKLAEFAVAGLENAQEIACDGTVRVLYENYVGLRKNNTYYSEQEVADAKRIYDIYMAEGNSNKLYELCRLTGNNVHSGYDASSIVSKSKVVDATISIPIYAFTIGNLAFTEAPYEMFDTNSKNIRDYGLNLNYDNVFVMGYSNGSNSYVPSQLGFTQGTETLYGSYESDQCVFRPIQYYVDGNGTHYETQNAAGTLTPVYVGEDLQGHFQEMLRQLKENQ